MRKTIAALLCTMAFAVPLPATATVNGIVLARGSAYLPGGDVYNGNTKVLETKSLILPAGATLTLRNLDVEAHNIHSGDPYLDGNEGDGLFRSDDANFNTSVVVEGVAALVPNEYRFFCTLHPAKVTGTLIIV